VYVVYNAHDIIPAFEKPAMQDAMWRTERKKLNATSSVHVRLGSVCDRFNHLAM